MNTNDLVSKIAAKRERLDSAENTKLCAEIEKRNALIAQICGMKDRIESILEVGNTLKENGFLYWHEDTLAHGNDNRLKKYGYNGAVVAEGIHHHVGFDAVFLRRTDRRIEWLAIRMGGCCGNYDFYTDGVTVKSELDSCEKKYTPQSKWEQDVPISHLEQFLREFPAFESAVYAWVDAEFS